MKKFNLFFVVAILATALFSACDPQEPSGKKNSNSNNNDTLGVAINGVRWATCNVGSTGTFVNNPEDYGDYYQWNRNDTANFLPYADYYASNYPSVTIPWLSANDPCPTGWRVPERDELETLLDTTQVFNELDTLNGISGIRFTDIVTGNSIFMSSAGFSVSGITGGPFNRGIYWSSTPLYEASSGTYAIYAATLSFHSEFAGAVGKSVNMGAGNMATGFSVRCVKQ